MGLRICLVTPFSWAKPHETNDHVAGVASALRARGHEVTVIAPSGRIADLDAGRRALARGDRPDVIAICPTIPISRRSRMGVPVGARASLVAALRQGEYDVVHGFEPALPSISYLALLEARGITAATFLSADRLGYPTRQSQRDRLLARVDALLATSETTARAAEARFPGSYTVVSPGVDLEVFAPTAKRTTGVVETRADGLGIVRSALASLRELPSWELHLAKVRPLAARPPIPSSLRPRVHVGTVRKSSQRAELLREAAIFVPAPGGSERLLLEAKASGCAIVDPPEASDQPELAGAALARLAEDDALRTSEGAAARREAEAQGFDAVADELDALYRQLGRRRRPARNGGDPLADREWIVADLHMHTSWSHDCSTDVAELLDHAESIGLGAVAITDHNVFGGALEAVELASGRELLVLPGEEVKTDGQGEVIGLFLRDEIPRGMSFADTLAAIREQDGIVYLPHPFDRMHAIPDPQTLHRHLGEIDVLEVYNARLLKDSYNDEALRFARKYGLLAGAGSDAHVLQGVGTGALRMRSFDGPEEFLLSLRTATVVENPKSLAYLQSLKWAAQVKEKVR